MVKFIEKDPNSISDIKQVHRGRVSYPILKGFMESGLFLAELDRTGMQQSIQALYSTLGAYIRNHEMPIKIFMRNGELHLMRLDVDKDGNSVEDWQYGGPNAAESIRITPEVVRAKEV